jgi:hypothetical protein
MCRIKAPRDAGEREVGEGAVVFGRPNSLVPVWAKLSIFHYECRPVFEACGLVLRVC